MSVLITDPELASRLMARRQESGGDRYDEVWEGGYMMAPLANNDHQAIQSRFVVMVQGVLGWDSAAAVCAGVNVSDRAKDWQFNYRCPDVVVYLPGNPAIDHGTHWQGGPDFLVEMLSPYDRGRDKLPFYAAVGVREIVVIDRNPWSMELYRRDEETADMRMVGTSSVTDGSVLVSEVLPLNLQLVAGPLRPRIQASLTDPAASQAEGRRQWNI